MDNTEDEGDWMMAVKILLIPFKLLIKLIGYLIVGILKIAGWFIRVVGTVCGMVTAIVGGIAILASVLFLIMGLAGVGSIRENSSWWLPGLVGLVSGAVVSSMGMWAVYVGEFLSELGDNIVLLLGDITFFQ